MVFTGGSAFYSESDRSDPGRTFLSLQAVFDLSLVTAIVHVTGSATSQFAALYILVIATSAVLLSTTGAFLAAALACVLYFGDVILLTESSIDISIGLQLLVFARGGAVVVVHRGAAARRRGRGRRSWRRSW